MAKMKLSESSFTMIPEGSHVFKVMEVDDSKYEDFGKIEVKLQTKSGQTHSERFGLRKNDGEINEGALKAWSYFAKTCLNNFSVEEIDTQDIVGCYITATVKHESYEYDKDGETKKGTSVRLNDYAVAVGFDSDSKEDEFVPVDEDVDDLDDFLND